MTNTDKIILVNPNDLDIKVDEEFKPEKSSGQINELYGKTSLASPILAGAKQEILLSTNLINYLDVDSFIEDKIIDLQINPEYLTIIASPLAIEMEYSGFNWPADVWEYSQIDEDPFIDLAVGRIMSLTITDVSSQISRILFYEKTLQNLEEVLVAMGSETNTGSAEVYTLGKALNAVGYQPTVTPEGTNPEDWKSKSMIFYIDHGGVAWAGISSLELPKLDNTFVSASACSTCAFKKIYNKKNLFALV